jgi:hypothetical protein
VTAHMQRSNRNTNRGHRRRAGRFKKLTMTLAAGLVMVLVPQFVAAIAQAAEPNQVGGLAADQHDGYATLSWTPVDGATDYQIERAVVNGDGSVGTAVIVGVWQPQRTVTPDQPRFADAGFALGGTYQWRVRARIGTVPQPFSDPVVGTTLPQWGTGPGASMRTQWESSGDATFHQ